MRVITLLGEGIGDLVILEPHTIEELVHIVSRGGRDIRGIAVGDLEGLVLLHAHVDT
jgi:hypothetical protein